MCSKQPIKSNIVGEEYLDIVDHNDQVIESMPRSQVYEQQLFKQMRSVWLLIKNSKGQLWIPRRKFDRALLPGHLDGSVVGHVQAGETYEQAMLREAQEEVGIDVSLLSYRELGKLSPHIHDCFCFAMVYELCMDKAPKFWNKQEFSEWFWLTPENILTRLKAGENIKDTLPIIVKLFYNNVG